MLIRLWWLIRKELQALMGNTQGRFLLIMPVLLQTALFPFAATLEVTGNTLAIYNQDGGARAASCWSASPICPPSQPSSRCRARRA